MSKGIRKEQITPAMRAERKLAKKAAKVKAKAAKAENKAKEQAERAALKATNLKAEQERRRAAKAKRDAKAKAKADQDRLLKASLASKLIALRVSKERAYTVRIKIVGGVPALYLVKVTDPNPKGIAESKAAKRARQSAMARVGLTSDGSLPGLTFLEAERIRDGIARKFASA